MTDTERKSDEEKFNETLKRMLKTPPKPKKQKGDDSKKPSPIISRSEVLASPRPGLQT